MTTILIILAIALIAIDLYILLFETEVYPYDDADH